MYLILGDFYPVIKLIYKNCCVVFLRTEYDYQSISHNNRLVIEFCNMFTSMSQLQSNRMFSPLQLFLLNTVRLTDKQGCENLATNYENGNSNNV